MPRKNSNARRLATPNTTTTPTRVRRTRKIINRWKGQEREISRHMQTADGPCEHIALKLLQSSTGRLGHLQTLRMDSASKNYIIEVKNRKLPKWIVDAWVLIQQHGVNYTSNGLLVLTLADEQAATGASPLYCISQDRHDYLLECERNYLASQQEKNDVH